MTSIAARAVRRAPSAAWNERYAGRILSPDGVASHYRPTLGNPHDVLRCLTLTGFDPGAAVYRYHSALNTAVGGIGAFARYEHSNPHCDLRQWDVDDDRAQVETLAKTADVLFCHSDYSAFDALGVRARRDDQLVVRMYHGSVTKGSPMEPKMIRQREDDAAGAVQLGARLYHKRFSARMHWAPIPMPVADYLALAATHWTPLCASRPTFLIGHSPSMRQIKGTTTLEFVVQALRRKGLDVALLNIEGKPHGEALAMKARCDVFFDSFWLGMQGSGLEAAAMGQAVVAGDPDARDDYVRELGFCPYTFADTPETLAVVLERLVVDAGWRTREALRVHRYTREYHDYPVVGARMWRTFRDHRLGFHGVRS